MQRGRHATTQALVCWCRMQQTSTNSTGGTRMCGADGNSCNTAGGHMCIQHSNQCSRVGAARAASAPQTVSCMIMHVMHRDALEAAGGTQPRGHVLVQ